MKTVNFIRLENNITYPVGIYIVQNLSIINKMGDILFDLYGKEKSNINLWCMGSSGAIIASLIATRFKNVVILHVKKENEPSHSDGTNANFFPSDINIIVDDMVATGKTVSLIYKEFCKQSIFNEIDCLCVSNTLLLKDIEFIPSTIICRSLYLGSCYASEVIRESSKIEL